MVESAPDSGDPEGLAQRDGRDGPPLLQLVGQWFWAAAIMLLLPRQWVSAALAAAVGLSLSAWLRWRRRRDARSRSPSGDQPSGDEPSAGHS